jgi:hypothetical protein
MALVRAEEPDLPREGTSTPPRTARFLKCAIAIVVSSEEVYGGMRMLSILSEEYGHVEVFRSLKEAKVSLGLE